MRTRRRQLKHLAFLLMVVLVHLSSLATNAVWVIRDYRRFSRDTDEMQAQALAYERALVRREVEWVLHLIDSELAYAGPGIRSEERTAEIQAKIIGAISTVRFGDEGYIFVLEADGTILTSAQTVDPTGETVSAVLHAARHSPHGTYVTYRWRKLTDEQFTAKLSYVQAAPAWGWIVGAGFYLDDLEAALEDRRALMVSHFRTSVVQSTLVLLLIITVTLLIGRRLSRRVFETIETFINDIGHAIVTNGTLEQPTQRFTELRSITRALNEVLSEKRAAERVLGESLREKEILLREVHHRTKNNLQIVSSILSIQAGVFDDERFQIALSDCMGRIQSIALVHDHLYQSERLSRIEMDEYLSHLAENLRSSHHELGPNVRLSLDLERGVTFGIDRAIPCGLIVTEIVTNSMRHAFTGAQEGTVTMRLFRNSEATVIELSDDGVGVPDGLATAGVETMGLTLIDALAEQLMARTVVSTTHGVRWRIEIPDA